MELRQLGQQDDQQGNKVDDKVVGIVLRVHAGQQESTNTQRSSSHLIPGLTLWSTHLHNNGHCGEELPGRRELLAIVDLFPLRKSIALVVRSFADPVQEVEMSQVVKYVRNRPGHGHGDNGQRHEENMQRSKEKQVDYPHATAIPPGHFGIGALRSVGGTQQHGRYAITDALYRH